MTRARVLIVEDEGIVAKDIKNRLIRLGYDAADIVPTGEDAIRRADELRPDLVLMDIMLRGRMDGIEAAEIIRSSCNIPVLYLTAYSDRGTLERAKITEPYGYILKPFDERELHITVEMALYRHKIEMRLKEREQWLDTTLKSIGDAVVATDRNGAITFVNLVAETLTGWKMEEALGKHLSEMVQLVSKHTREAIECPAARAIQAAVPVNLPADTVLIPKNGDKSFSKIPVEINIDDSAAPIRNKNGEIVGAVLVFRDASERLKKEEQLRHHAYHDSLTGLPNRLLFHDRLSISLFEAKRQKKRVAVAFLDLDGFKPVNDAMGHDAGDMLLKLVTERLSNCARHGDTVARIGGDEFILALLNISKKEEAGDIIRRHLDAIRETFIINGCAIRVSASIGISLFPDDGDDVDSLMKKADNAMYIAKGMGKNRYRFYQE